MFSKMKNKLDLAKGKKSSGKLLYVQYVDPNTETTHEITDPFLKDFILDVKFSDPYFTYNASSTMDSNLDILKNALSDKIINVHVYSCPMDNTPEWIPHTYAVFQTEDTQQKQMWWSFEKNGEDIVLQQSPYEEDVTKYIYDNTKTQNISRLETVEVKTSAPAQGTLENLLRYFWNAGQIYLSYHLFLSNCWQFAEFVFEKLNTEGRKWTPPVGYKKLRAFNCLSSTVIGRPGLDAETVMNSIQTDDNYTIATSLRLAISHGTLKDLQTLLDKHPKTIDNVDARGYTLIEWAQVLSEEAEKYLKGKNAKVQEDASSSKKNFNKLFIALFGNETQQTKFITEESVNAVNSLGETPLHLAAKLSNCTTKTFQMLLDTVNNLEFVNKVDNYGYTPLHWAFYTRSLEKIKRLIKKGANIEIHVNDVNGDSPLQLAVQRWGHAPEEEFQIIQELFAQKVITKQAIETKNKKGFTALHSALLLQSKSFSTFFLKKGADVNIATKDGSTSLHLAVQWPACPEELLGRILNSTKNLHAKNHGGKTALHCALESQSSIACKMLLEKKKNGVNIATANGEIALHLAAKWSGIGAKLFTTLLGKTTEINKPDSIGRTPLHCALLFKSVTATKILLNKDATVNAEAQTCHNLTALHLAALWSDIPMNLFEIILRKFKANLNAQDKYGRTALHCAILSKSETLIDKLLDANADATIHERDGLTPLHLAADWRQPIVPDISTRLFNKILTKSSSIVNAKCSRGQTALHFALASHSTTATDALLKHENLDVNMETEEDELAIHRAAKWQQHIPNQLLKIIMDKTDGDKLNSKHLGNTPLDYARESGLSQTLINLLPTPMGNQQ
jgi:ankyrin repeat protein